MYTSSRLRNIYKYKTMYLFLLPAVIVSLIFFYRPMIGIIMAFQDYDPVKGFYNSTFVGLQHFRTFLVDPDFYKALKNTLGINILMLILGFPLPIMFALILNEIRFEGFKRVTQTITYLPHFISWVVVAGLAYRLLEQDYGNINLLINFFGGEKIAFFREAKYFWGTLVSISIWKELGWNSIIYLAALSSIDQEQYEAATVDGAGRFKKLVYITLPGIAPTIGLMLILTLGTLVTSTGGVSFDAVFNMQNAMVADASTNLDIYIYDLGIRWNKMSLAASVGLVQSLVSLILVIGSNFISRKFKGYGAF